jgi:hypothetical protein
VVSGLHFSLAPASSPQLHKDMAFRRQTSERKWPNQALQLTADRCVTTVKFYERVLDIESLGFVSGS